MSGHGWVIPNKNGGVARCGGPAFCPECALELVQNLTPKERAKQLSPEELREVRVFTKYGEKSIGQIFDEWTNWKDRTEDFAKETTRIITAFADFLEVRARNEASS